MKRVVLAAWLKQLMLSAALFALTLSAALAAPQTSPCAICSVREKAGPESVAATWVYQGKTYSFCSEACKAEFQRDPEPWIRAAAEAAPAEPHQRPRGCYELASRAGITRLSIRQAKATKCRPASVSGNRS
jgi:YHS domain-containing protein